MYQLNVPRQPCRIAFYSQHKHFNKQHNFYLFKLKETLFKCDSKNETVFHTLKNTVGKKEKMLVTNIFSFSIDGLQFFSKAPIPQSLDGNLSNSLYSKHLNSNWLC